MKLLLLSALLASTCEVGPFPKPAPQPGPPSPWDTPTDAAPPPEEIDAAAHTPCYLACQRLTKLGCPEAQPTAEGATCTQVCTNIESTGNISMGPECVAGATTCKIARACAR
jgi:hypothetical protein